MAALYWPDWQARHSPALFSYLPGEQVEPVDDEPDWQLATQVALPLCDVFPVAQLLQAVALDDTLNVFTAQFLQAVAPD